MQKYIFYLQFLLFSPILLHAEGLGGGTQTQGQPTLKESNSSNKELPAEADYIIKEKAMQKYECRCFRWSKNGEYRLAHSKMNRQGTTINYIEDLQNGGTISNFRWDAKENRLKYDDAPSLDKKIECFSPESTLKILKQTGGKVLAVGRSSFGTDVSAWIQSEDLEKLDKASPEFKKRERLPPTFHSPCNS